MSIFRRFALLVGLIALAACGNQPDQGLVIKKITSGALKKTGKGGGATPETIVAEVQGALGATKLPVALAVVENRNAAAIITRIEQNGAYDTWGARDRRTITTRRGVVTATRGLGNDLMSSESSAVVAMVSGRKAGTATRTMRYLDGENKTVELVLTCQYAKSAGKRLTAGDLKNVATMQITESCASGSTSFTNTYLVDGRGRPIQSRQWLGPTGGYIVMQLLR